MTACDRLDITCENAHTLLFVDNGMVYSNCEKAKGLHKVPFLLKEQKQRQEWAY